MSLLLPVMLQLSLVFTATAAAVSDTVSPGVPARAGTHAGTRAIGNAGGSAAPPAAPALGCEHAPQSAMPFCDASAPIPARVARPLPAACCLCYVFLETHRAPTLFF